LGNVFRLFISLVVAAIFVAFTQVPAGAFIICSSLLGNCPAGYTDDPVPMKPAITKDSINGVLMGPGFWDPMTFKLAVALSQMQIIYAVGDIGVDTPGKFAGFLKANNIKPGALVVFNSPGGNPSAGMLIGRIIRRDSLRTSIGKERTNSTSLLSASLQPGICASSCSLAFLGGVERTVPHGSLYGVHDISMKKGATSFDDPLDAGQKLAADMAKYFIEQGVSMDLLSILTAYNSNQGEIGFLDPFVMEQLKVTTVGP
jgi:hypothetical protein